MPSTQFQVFKVTVTAQVFTYHNITLKKQTNNLTNYTLKISIITLTNNEKIQLLVVCNFIARALQLLPVDSSEFLEQLGQGMETTDEHTVPAV